MSNLAWIANFPDLLIYPHLPFCISTAGANPLEKESAAPTCGSIAIFPVLSMKPYFVSTLTGYKPTASAIFSFSCSSGGFTTTGACDSGCESALAGDTAVGAALSSTCAFNFSCLLQEAVKRAAHANRMVL